MKNLGVSYRRWKVQRYESKRVRALEVRDSIALGFAWRAENIGGVRRHLECIEKYSTYPVALYPSTYASELLQNRKERDSYHQALGDSLIDQHALFHSHVDPRFVRLSRKAQESGKPWIHTYHAFYLQQDWGDQLAPWQIEINDCLLTEARHADICLSITSWTVDWLKQNYDIESRFLPNGVDTNVCDAAQADRFTRRYNIAGFVLFVGSMAHIKNPLFYIEVAQRIPDQIFVMIGTGLTKDKIEAFFGIEIPDNLKPLGPLPHDQTLDAIAACKAFVMTSHREGLPTVLLEAMSMKKPSVVPDAPWCADVILSDEHGLRYEPGNLDDLAEKTREALDSKPFDAAREHIDANFTWPVILRQLDQIYAELLS